jgi:hypothetical protein
MRHEPAVVGCYPRDDVWTRWSRDGRVRTGVARLYATDAPPPYDDRVLAIGRVDLGDLGTVTVDRPAGSLFTAVLEARFEADLFEATVVFRLTGDENDVAQVTVGPGLVEEPGRWHRMRYGGFLFGVTVLGAVVEDRPR